MAEKIAAFSRPTGVEKSMPSRRLRRTMSLGLQLVNRPDHSGQASTEAVERYDRDLVAAPRVLHSARRPGRSERAPDITGGLLLQPSKWVERRTLRLFYTEQN